MLLCHGFDNAESVKGGVLEVAVAVHFTCIGVDGGVPAFVRDVRGLVLAREDAASELVLLVRNDDNEHYLGTYRIVDDNVKPILSATRNKLFLDVASDCVVHSLVDGRLHPLPFIGDVPHLGHLPSSEVAESELNELALFEKLVASLHRLFERCASVWSMQVEDIHTVCTKLTKRLVQTGFQRFLCMLARRSGVALGGESEAALLPLGFFAEAFLVPSDVCTSSIDFVVSLALQEVKTLVVVFETGNSGSFRFCARWTKGHKT